MTFLEILLLAVALAMDCFAVSIAAGVMMRKMQWNTMLRMTFLFGLFQAGMPFAGWLLGSQFAGYIQNIDHWVAFVLLVLIGGNMAREALSPEEEETACAVDQKLDYKQLLLMAVATSIDALAVGISLAMAGTENIFLAVGLIGLMTFLLSALVSRVTRREILEM